ncbi:MAG: hypothetical protein EBZ67_14155, partial [Chitinophagia bacterium]|nr:hypothetical protein [Chitinophagia bacterium]
MRHPILLLSLLIACPFAQGQPGRPDPYAADWRKTEKLLEQGLPQSALARIENTLLRARREGNEAQQLKALYWMGLAAGQQQEDATARQIDRLQRELKAARGTRKALLHGMIGKAYWVYLQENRWNLYQQRSGGGNEADLDSWSADELHQAISRHLRLSLTDAAALQAIPTRDWQPIVSKGVRHTLRPTLYDLLAHAALDYFTRADNEIHRFTRSFEIDDTTAFAPADRFATHTFPTRDSLSHQAVTLSILQSLLRLHLKDADPEALIEADLERLRFVHEKSVLDDREA